MGGSARSSQLTTGYLWESAAEFQSSCVSIAVSLDLAKQFGVSIKVATGPHEDVAGLQ
jgi:hypothetical protein